MSGKQILPYRLLNRPASFGEYSGRSGSKEKIEPFSALRTAIYRDTGRISEGYCTGISAGTMVAHSNERKGHDTCRQ